MFQVEVNLGSSVLTKPLGRLERRRWVEATRSCQICHHSCGPLKEEDIAAAFTPAHSSRVWPVNAGPHVDRSLYVSCHHHGLRDNGSHLLSASQTPVECVSLAEPKLCPRA